VEGTQSELELLADEVRRIAGLDDDDFVVATRLAARLLGPNAVALDTTQCNPAYLRVLDDGYQIVINPASGDMRFHVAHEVAEWALRSIAKFDGPHVLREQAADRLAAAILAPRAAVRSAHATIGERIPKLAARFGISQTAIVLRLAEVHGDERAVVTRTGNVMIRTQGAFPWAEVPVVSVARGEARWAGLAKAKLRGGIDEGRVALRAVGVE